MESAWDKYLKWCKTKSGKTVLNRACIAVNIGIFGALYMPHTFLLKKYQNLVQLHEDRKPVPIPDNIKSLYNEVLDDLKVHELEHSFIEPFMVIGFDTFQAGMNDTRTGGIIGIPINFTFSKARDLEPSRLLINNSPVNWARKETEDLAEALVLSHDAKKFGIAREIRSFQKSGRLLDCCIGSVLFMAFYFVCQVVKDKYNMHNKPLKYNLILYTIAGFIGLSIYFAQKDFLRKKIERDVDEELSKLGPNYAKGGHEFYSKLLQRNLAHRSLLDKHGHELFKEDGNPAYYIREKTTPITKRLSLFESQIKKFMEEQQETLNSNVKNIASDVETA